MSRIGIAALILGALANHAYAAPPEDRIWLNVRINQKSERFVFDSGSSWSILLSKTAEQLGLKTLPGSTNDFPLGFSTGFTEEVPLTIERRQAHIKFAVVDTPWYAPADFDGMIGWYDIGGSILQLNADHAELQFLDRLPKQISRFSRFAIMTNYGTVDLELPGPTGTNRVLCIDTGAPDGVALPALEWLQWKHTHPHILLTLDTQFSFLDRFRMVEQAWADQVQIGPLTLTNVPIQQASRGSSDRYGPRYAGTLGLAALRQLDLVIDGSTGQAYIHPKKVRPKRFEHNRLGAIFMPDDTHTNQGIATVIEGSPAFDAGVRNGDRLLQVDDVRVRGWTSDWLDKFTMRAGTKLSLKLERNKTNFSAIATLRDIVAPGATRNTVRTRSVASQ